MAQGRMAQSSTDEGGGNKEDARGIPQVLTHLPFNPTRPKEGCSSQDGIVEGNASGESRDIISEDLMPSTSRYLSIRQSSSTYRSSPGNSRPCSPITVDSKPSLATSATTTSLFTIDVSSDHKPDSPQRPSILRRLTSSPAMPQCRHSIQPSEFEAQPEQPEKHFIDSVGMVIPGVCNRIQCSHPRSHFVINWRLCEPVEYTTTLADHGITYSDYSRLLATLAHFLVEISSEPKRRKEATSPRMSRMRQHCTLARSEERVTTNKQVPRREIWTRSLPEPIEGFRKTAQQAASLNAMLSSITVNWQARGLPVMVSVSSFSLFPPNCISESHIQVLHVPLKKIPSGVTNHATQDQHQSFLDPFSNLIATHCVDDASVSVPWRRDSQGTETSLSYAPSGVGTIFHHSQWQMRDRSRPWPLWPNAIPTRQRGLMESHADRYGIDPHFRAWMRANINSRTTSTSYAKYLIEREDNPFVNKRLEYVDPRSRAASVSSLATGGYKKWKEQHHALVNRIVYSHNRRLECRKTVEHGSRLRIVRFGFRHPIYPLHTPEMDELGLTRQSYENIISDIEAIRLEPNSMENVCIPQLLPCISLRRRRTDDTLARVSEYIRNVNARQRRIVWTIEKIPGAYDKRVGHSGKEWEISAWNGEDPLELLLQLEKWGIIEQRLGFDEDE